MHQEENFEFNSCFESGNLDLVKKEGQNEYNLYIRTDSNTKGDHLWFYFSVKNKLPEIAKFNIKNLTKRDTNIGKGMRIAVFSDQKAQKALKEELPSIYKDWHLGGESITYKQTKLGQDNIEQGQHLYT